MIRLETKRSGEIMNKNHGNNKRKMRISNRSKSLEERHYGVRVGCGNGRKASEGLMKDTIIEAFKALIHRARAAQKNNPVGRNG